MGKSELRIVVIRKPLTYALLLLTTAAICGLIVLLSGRAYAGSSNDFVGRIVRLMYARRATNSMFIAALMPVAANLALFVPWGFLSFLAFDRTDRPRLRTYLLCYGLGLSFAMSLVVWQFFLPTQVLSVADGIVDSFGALAGATLGHLRKSVRVRFV